MTLKTTVRFDNGAHVCRIAFRCRTCKRWICGHEEGTSSEHEDGSPDPEAFARCDGCWTRLMRRRARRGDAEAARNLMVKTKARWLHRYRRSAVNQMSKVC